MQPNLIFPPTFPEETPSDEPQISYRLILHFLERFLLIGLSGKFTGRSWRDMY
jgi:hypothetical protein